MRFGVVLLSLMITEFLLVLFGYIAPNSLVGVLFGSSQIIDLLQINNLAGSLILGTTAVVGIYLKNNLLVFSSITIFLMNSVLGISGIISYFPEPIGYLVYGIISFILVWTGLEWWRTMDN